MWLYPVLLAVNLFFALYFVTWTSFSRIALVMVGLFIAEAAFIWLYLRKSTHEIEHPGMYGDVFVEEAFPTENAEYRRRVTDGYAIAKESRICMCGIVTSDTNIQRLKNRWTNIAACFASYKFVLVTDQNATVKGLDGWVAEDTHVFVLTSPEPSPKIPGLTMLETKRRKLVDMRNRYLTEIPSDATFVLVMDTQSKGPLSVDGLMNSVSYLHDGTFDALYANSLLINEPLTYQFDAVAWKQSLSPAQRGDEPTTTHQGFGGATIYKSIKGQTYKWNKEESEHVGFHSQFAKVGLNPSMIQLRGCSHA